MERKRNYYTTITKRLLVAFFCLSVVPIACFAWIMKGSVEETNIIKLNELATSTIEHRAEVITQFLKDKINTLSMLVTLYSEDYFFNKENVEKVFLAMNSKGDIVDLQVIDVTGFQHAYVGPYRAKIEGKKYDDAPWFRETLISGVHVSDVFMGFRNTPHFVVAVTDPLKNYVLRATINSSIFNSLLHSAQLGPHGDAFIVNRVGELQTPSLLGKTDLSETDKTLLAFENNSSSIITSTDISATRSIDNGHWQLVVTANIADSLHYYLRLRDKIISIVIAISLISMIAATFVSLVLSKNIERADKEYATLGLQFVQVEKMATVGRLAAGIAHEINNPLQMITNQAGWISELLPDEDPTLVKNLGEYQKAVQQIKHHVQRAGTITHRLLGFSRKMSSQQEKVQVNELLLETVSFVERQAGYDNITIVKNLDNNLPGTMTDGPQLQQVFLNLINNAIDAVGHGGKIELSSKTSRDGKLVLEFADSGPGIKPENIKQIFDPFFTTKDPGKGTGLGLYISYDIIQKLGGSITVANRKGGGAIFTIVLPVISFGESK
ncbi:PAS domain-containing sensor histidine kinase [Desulforhopalus sp. IMCC35007]|uniref:sensor histidine kinase n=1 Tax=Desulforhopalus sp. IMCC35007 TaxID=2569543 RepID=UPI00145EBDC0|nr:PAS domain-containing sensor histidine kinase [Desulforhopalus sp. IMCC35007]